MPERITTHCAACRKLLGTLTGDDGWFWHTGSPARLVNRRRRICEISHPNDAPTADFNDYRMRTVEKALVWDPEKGDTSTMQERFIVWEYPYTCDDDACMDGLSDDWAWTVNQSGPRREPKFTLLPAGRVLS